jgi:xylulokinase
MPHVVGVDSSTSACKIQVHDLDTGEIVAVGRASHPATRPPRSEQEPRAWRDAFDTACQQAGVGSEFVPAGLSVAAQQHGMVLLGEDGEVLRPAKLWNDTESAPDADALISDLEGGAAAWANACGSVPVPSFTITKLHWMARREPKILARTGSVLLPHDWLTYTLTGGRTTDRGDASGTGYWSPREFRYRKDLLDLVNDKINWDDLLPRVLGPTDAAGEWLGGNTVIGPGTGDNMAIALGLGLRPGDLALSFGTSATAFTVSETPTSDPTGSVAGFADASGRFLPLVCTMNATKVIDAVATLLGVDHDRFDALVLDAPPGANGLILVPHFDGERTPNRPKATGILRGLRTEISPALLARATVEGVVCNLLEGATQLNPSLHGRVLLVGGAAKSPAFQQVVADLVGSPVHVVSKELVATGAAVQAAATSSGLDLDSIAKQWNLADGETVEPDTAIDHLEIRAHYADAVAREANLPP